MSFFLFLFLFLFLSSLLSPLSKTESIKSSSTHSQFHVKERKKVLLERKILRTNIIIN